jgi:hypothetical protein
MRDFSDVRIFLCTTPTNMNYSFDRLMGRAQEIFDQDPCSGHLFLFLNRDRDRIKILFWDRDGFCIWYKKLEAEDTQIFGFTEIGRRAHNQPFGVAEARHVVGISRQSGPRRSVMSGQGSPIVPPRALRQRGVFHSTNSGRS